MYVIIVSKHTNETIYIHLIHYTHIPLLLSRECQGRVQRVRVRGREGGEKKGVGRKGGERKRGVREG